MSHSIVYESWTFPADKIKEGNLYLAASLLASSLEVNSFVPVVECDDPSILDFQRNAKLLYYPKPDRPMVFRVQSINRIAPELYEISSTSTLGLLTEGLHMGGVYTGQTAEEVIADICGTVVFEIKNVLKKIKLYGWLPVATPRDNLAQVLFAIGAALKTDLEGVLRIEGLWVGISGQVPQDNLYTDAAVDYGARITQVIVTEHQYIPWTEEKQLFEGTAQAGDIITFDEPMHSLSAQGFAIQASGANWARVSAGAGTLTGKIYIHNTRQISRDVQAASTPNVKTVEDATLVSLVNSQAVAERLADYYRCRERVDSAVVYQGEAPGDRLAVYHPFDKTGVAACLESADITLSNTLKAQEKLLVGYVPPQTGDVSYLDFREVLTGSGQWTPPEGVTEVTYVMFSGAQGGRAGVKGGDSAAARSHSYSHTSWITGQVTSRGTFRLWGNGGKGGQGGPGGKGSKILQGTMNVEPGVPLSYSCGVGSAGSTSNSAEAAEGTPTTFHGLTTDSGSYPSAAGWQDPFTQEIFASTGPSGLPGGDGAGARSGYTIPDNSGTLADVLAYQPSTGAYDEDGRYWPGAPTRENGSGVAWYSTPWDTNDNGSGGAQAGYALGPGGAAGVSQSAPSVRGSVSVSNRDCYASAASGRTPPRPATPRKRGLTLGGRGGYGGGGASASSWAGVEVDASYEGTVPNASVSPGAAGTGGPGGYGSPGGDGMIILFYSKAQKSPAGQLVDKNSKMVLDRLGRRIIM